MKTQHPLNKLKPRGKPPATARAIEVWIQQAESIVGIGAARLGWMVASGVAIAAVQRAQHSDGLPRFLLKGGAYLELRLGLQARATKDVDTLFRGEFSEVLDVLDEALDEPFDGIMFERTSPKRIEVPGRIIKPYRLDVLLQIRGKTWRRICLEISPDEGGIGATTEQFESPSLAHFGLNTPPTTAGISVDYQVAQKLHACTDPNTEERPNIRVRDIVDLHLLKSAFYPTHSELGSLRNACKEIFTARELEAINSKDHPPRKWPPQVIAHSHWETDYAKFANEVGITLPFPEAIAAINGWIRNIEEY